MFARAVTLFVVSLLMACPSVGFGQVDVFMDFTDFQTRLDEATASAGVANFSTAEALTIKNNVIGGLNGAFSGYSVNFTESNPGGQFSTLSFSQTGGGYGSADGIDFLNKIKNDEARVFVASFDDFLESTDSRADQISEVSFALTGTAAHEVGHNFGLQHFDPYGIASFTATNSMGGFVTGGAQNAHIMATGFTGLSEEEREVVRTFSDLSAVKLHMAEGVSANQINVTSEAASHGSIATAQHLILDDVAFGSEYEEAAVVEGFFGGAREYFSVDLNAGDKIVIQALSAVNHADPFDTLLRFIDANGSTVLFENDDMEVNSNGVNVGNLYSDESMLWNLPIAVDGRYFIELDSFGAGDSGDYDLMVAVDRFSNVPEPSGIALLSLLSLTMIRRRRES